jgi:hypothetical protein
MVSYTEVDFNLTLFPLQSQLHLVSECTGTLGTSDFEAQMSGIQILKGNEILRPVYKKPFSEILSGCFHFGLFSS